MTDPARGEPFATNAGTPRRVVVTGLGCVSPHGDVESLWRNLCEGRSAIRRLRAFDPTGFHSCVAGEAEGFDAAAYLPARMLTASSRCLHLAVAAGKMAVHHANLVVGRTDPRRIGIYLGTSIGPLGYALQQYGTFLEKGIERVHPMAPAQNYPGVIASELAILLGTHGPALTISTACTSGADAIGFALSQLRAGVVDVAIAGASEAPLFPSLFAAFDRLGLMSRWSGDPNLACRPFSTSRDGFALSEGSAVCILETESSATSRGVAPLAEIAGFAATSDGYHHFHQLPSGEEAVRAMRDALADASLDADAVGWVCAHGTATPANDPIEARVIRRAFESRATRIPVSAIKSMIGHTMGASGVFGVLACVKAVQERVLPPTINLYDVDPECDLDHVRNEARHVPVRAAMSNTFGFGSRNAVIIVKAIEA